MLDNSRFFVSHFSSFTVSGSPSKISDIMRIPAALAAVGVRFVFLQNMRYARALF